MPSLRNISQGLSTKHKEKMKVKISTEVLWENVRFKKKKQISFQVSDEIIHRAQVLPYI